MGTTGNPLFDNPTLKAQFASQLAAQNAPPPLTMPPGGMVSTPPPLLPPSHPAIVTGPKRGQATMSSGEPIPLGTPLGDKLELQRKLSQGPGDTQIAGKIEGSRFGQAHPFLGKALGIGAQGLAQLGDIGLTALAPRVAGLVPGTALHHGLQVKAGEQQVAGDEANAEKEAQTQEAVERGPLIQAQTDEAEGRARALDNPSPKAESPQQGYADAIADAIKRGVDPATDPHVNAWRDAITSAQKETTPAPKSMEAKTIVGPNGKPMSANYHPDTGKYTDSAGKEIPNAVPYQQPNYASMLPLVLGAKTTDIVDPNTGLPTVTQYNPETRTYDKPVGTAGTGSYGHQVESAAAAERMINQNILPLIAKMEKQGEMGIVQGRFSDFLNRNVGDAPPDVAELHQLMNGVVSMMMGMYGFRRQQAVDSLSSQMGARMTPESMRGALTGMLLHAKTIQGGATNPSAGGEQQNQGQGQTPPPGAKIVKFEDIK